MFVWRQSTHTHNRQGETKHPPTHRVGNTTQWLFCLLLASHRIAYIILNYTSIPPRRCSVSCRLAFCLFYIFFFSYLPLLRTLFVSVRSCLFLFDRIISKEKQTRHSPRFLCVRKILSLFALLLSLSYILFRPCIIFIHAYSPPPPTSAHHIPSLLSMYVCLSLSLSLSDVNL